MLVLMGILLGLLSATISESFFHKFFGHPFEKVKKLYFKNTKLFSACLKPYYQHFVIHHKKTYLNHFFTQFDSKEHNERVDSWIEKNFDEGFRNLIWIERYNLTLKGFIGTLPFAGPFCIGPALIYNFFGLEAFLGSLITAYIPVWMSKYIHPLIHAPEETHKHSSFIQWLMKTKYMEAVLLNHYLHHNDGDKNFNLFLGGDYLIGLNRVGSEEELENFQVLLKEFRYKVRNEVIVECPRESGDLISKRDILLKEYCKKNNPTTEERYSFQKDFFLLNEKTSGIEWDYESFGFSLYSKEVDFFKWNKREEFSLDAYDFFNGEIYYRGNKFRTGDILLTNQQSDADGLFSTLLERDINFAHAAVFINLEFNNKIYPSVIEINEYGTRAVPLKAFLSKDFNSYVEAFRLFKGIDSNQEAALGEAALEFLGETHGFDIYQDRGQSHYLNCARTVERIFHKAGIELRVGDSKYDEQTFSNLHTLGIQESIGKELLMPDDFSLNREFKLVGAISNSNVEDMISRNLARAYFQKIWRKKKLRVESFPILERINFHIIKVIQKNNIISKVILSLIGFKFEEFPSGPARFLSLVSFGDKEMAFAVRPIREELRREWKESYRQLEWEELISHPRMILTLKKSSEGFCKIFERKETPLKRKNLMAKFLEHYFNLIR